MSKPRQIEIAQKLKGFAAEFDEQLSRLLQPEGGVPSDLAEAVRYAALAPGKRMRPFLLVRCCELTGGRHADAWAAAAALECVHAFSLAHDDLPAMDNDDLRRGQPTTHKKFGEALGILAGDALVVRAFEIIAREYPGALAGALVAELAWAAGWAGMIGGQADDLSGQTKVASLELTKSIHVRKTGRLFAAACRMGAVVGSQSDGATERRSDGGEGTGGQAARHGRSQTSGTQAGMGIKGSRDQGIGGRDRDGGATSEKDLIEGLGWFGLRLGEAFQIADDVLDVTASAEALGKSPGKDVTAGKQTYPRCVGVEASRAAAEQAVAEAIELLEPFGAEADDLRALGGYVVVRDY